MRDTTSARPAHPRPVFPDEPIRSVPQELKKGGKVTVNPMHAAFGVRGDRTCGDCVHLFARQLSGRYLKCEMRSLSGSASSDHRAGWIACGLFEARDE